MAFDPIDIRLLTALQKNGQATSQELADILNLSPSQAGRRRQRLEAEGYISHYTARLDPERLGLHVQAFIQVQLARHGAEHAESFGRLIGRRDEIVSAWTLTGEADYLLRSWTPDLSGLNRLIHDVILAHPAVGRVQSQIVMAQPKADAPLPV